MTEQTSDEILKRFGGSQLGLITCLSFEERSLVVPKLLAVEGLKTWVCIENEDIETDITAMRNRAQELAGNAGIDLWLVKASKREPLKLADTLISISHRIEQSALPLRWVADVSTMTHEMVLVIVAAADELISQWKSLDFVYNIAGAYSVDDDAEEKWVSRGIQGVRSVVGYPGSWDPGDRAVLVALPGFDLDRIERIVDEVEPDQIIVGVATPTTNHHPWSHSKNLNLAQKLVELRDGSIFQYSALDPYSVIDALISNTSNIRKNILIAPLNSKISTVAVGVLARHIPEWQVCYAPALIYNLNYSVPSDNFATCSFEALKDYVVKAIPPTSLAQSESN